MFCFSDVFVICCILGWIAVRIAFVFWRFWCCCLAAGSRFSRVMQLFWVGVKFRRGKMIRKPADNELKPSRNGKVGAMGDKC